LKAAKDLSNSERMDMIQGMVQRLSERLATQGGTSQEWAQLIRALIVLKDEDQATAVWEDAKSVFAQYPDDLAIIESVAKETGVIK
jgi:cytochrome c-type biogenesis protein CcmH